MINCFIDPIFLTIGEGFDFYKYAEEIFGKLSELFDKIEELEKYHRVRFLKINMNQYFIDECINRNPFTSKDNRRRYELFLAEILRMYVNSNCEDKYIYNQIENPEYSYENRNISDSMIIYWNSYINQCAHCKGCKLVEKEMLSIEDLGTKIKTGTPDYFSEKYYDWVDWLTKTLISANILEVYPSKEDSFERKTKIYQFLININVFLKKTRGIFNQQYEILDDFWNSDFIYTDDKEFRLRVFDVISDILINPGGNIHRRHNLQHREIMINDKKNTIVQYDVFQEYRLKGVDITPRLLVAFHESKVFFYKIENRH